MKASLSITPMRGATHGETLVPESPILFAALPAFPRPT